MEKALADAMRAAGYRVMNDVKSGKPLDEVRFAGVRKTFAKSFPGLAED